MIVSEQSSACCRLGPNRGGRTSNAACYNFLYCIERYAALVAAWDKPHRSEPPPLSPGPLVDYEGQLAGRVGGAYFEPCPIHVEGIAIRGGDMRRKALLVLGELAIVAAAITGGVVIDRWLSQGPAQERCTVATPGNNIQVDGPRAGHACDVIVTARADGSYRVSSGTGNGAFECQYRIADLTYTVYINGIDGMTTQGYGTCDALGRFGEH